MHSYCLQVEAELEGTATTSLLQDAGTAQSQPGLPHNKNGQRSEDGVPAPSQATSESETLVTAEQQRHDPTEL